MKPLPQLDMGIERFIGMRLLSFAPPPLMGLGPFDHVGYCIDGICESIMSMTITYIYICEMYSREALINVD